MKSSWGCLFALSILCTAVPSMICLADSSIERPTIYLVEGEQRALLVPEITRFSLGSDCVRAIPEPTLRPSHGHHDERILLKAVRPGNSDLWVWKRDGSTEHRPIEVLQSSPEELQPALRKALGRLEEAEVYLAGPGIILRGKIGSTEESARIESLLQGFPGLVHDETEPADGLLSSARVRLESWIRSSPFSTRLQVRQVDRSLIIGLAQGSIQGPEELELIQRRARAIYPLVRFQLSALPDTSPTVHFKVYLLELKRSRFHTLGISWPDAKPGAFQVSPTGISSQLQLDLTLQMLAGEGSARILSNPELVVRAPGEAELFSGGELPIRLESPYYSELSWKTFGLTLRLKVNQSAGDQVRLDIFTEVSHLDPALTSDQVPGIQSNRMKTQVDARYGTPLFLSGLLQRNLRRQARGIPLLREIPILGSLFGSEDYLNENSELVAILVPSRELPPAPLDRLGNGFGQLLPHGHLPPPRVPARFTEERKLREAPDFPWNVLR